MRPKDEHNRKLLEHFIKELIDAKSVDTIARTIPQKGAIVLVGNRVLIGVVPKKSTLYQKFLDGTATLYYTGTEFPTDISLDNLHFFIPYVEGIRDVYEKLIYEQSLHKKLKTYIRMLLKESFYVSPLN